MSEHADDTVVTLVGQQNELLSAMEGCAGVQLRDLVEGPADAYDQLMTCCRPVPKERRKSTSDFENHDLTTGCSVLAALLVCGAADQQTQAHQRS